MQQVRRARRRVGVKRRIVSGGRRSRAIGWYKILRAHTRRRKGTYGRRHAIKNRHIKWTGVKGRTWYRSLLKLRGRKGRRVVFTNPDGTTSAVTVPTTSTAKVNPMRRRTRRHRRNPSLKEHAKHYFMDMPRSAMAVKDIFTGKGAPARIALTSGAFVGTYLIGGYASHTLAPYIAKIPGMPTLMANPIGARVMGAIFPWTIAFVGSRFIKDTKIRSAVMIGGAVATALELIKPGVVGGLLQKIPGLQNLPGVSPAVAAATAGPVQGLQGYFGSDLGLSGYVNASQYQGAGADAMLAADTVLAGYVNAAGYQGTAGLKGYVDASSYQGTGGYLDEGAASVMSMDEDSSYLSGR